MSRILKIQTVIGVALVTILLIVNPVNAEEDCPQPPSNHLITIVRERQQPSPYTRLGFARHKYESQKLKVNVKNANYLFDQDSDGNYVILTGALYEIAEYYLNGPQQKDLFNNFENPKEIGIRYLYETAKFDKRPNMRVNLLELVDRYLGGDKTVVSTLMQDASSADFYNVAAEYRKLGNNAKAMLYEKAAVNGLQSALNDDKRPQKITAKKKKAKKSPSSEK